MSDTHRCQDPGCDGVAMECSLSFGDDVEWLCAKHAEKHGYCVLCGIFSAGIESYDFHHPGYCDECWDELNDPIADDDDDDWDGFEDEYEVDDDYEVDDECEVDDE